MKKIVFLILICLLFSSCTIAYADSNTNYETEIVMEVNTNIVLHEKDANRKMYMASTTKILTAICAIENTELDVKHTIKKEWCNVEGSSIYLNEGEKLTPRELLYGLMLRSGNDTAVALACITSNSIENFSKLMNETALKIGAKNSNFVNPHGLHDDNHYTTAYDLALITCYALKNPTFKEIVSTKKINISNDKYDYERVLINKNKMLNQFDGATGVKTGYTKKAGRCLVSSANKNGFELVTVVLNCQPMFERSAKLLNSSYAEYEYRKVLESDYIVDFIELPNRKNKYPIALKNDVYLPLKKDEANKIETKITVNENIRAPIVSNQEIGKIDFYIKNNLIFSQKIYTICNID